jgi:hypothetical protein
MRHIPPVEYLVFKIDVDYRARVQKLLRCFDEVRETIDQQEREVVARHFLAVAHGLERICEVLRPSRSSRPPDDLRARLETAFANAAQALMSADEEALRTRAPDSQFEKSSGEVLLGAFLVLSDRIRLLTESVAGVAPAVWETLLEGTVNLQHPLNEETLRPIA